MPCVRSWTIWPLHIEPGNFNKTPLSSPEIHQYVPAPRTSCTCILSICVQLMHAHTTIAVNTSASHLLIIQSINLTGRVNQLTTRRPLRCWRTLWLARRERRLSCVSCVVRPTRLKCGLACAPKRKSWSSSATTRQ